MGAGVGGFVLTCSWLHATVHGDQEQIPNVLREDWCPPWLKPKSGRNDFTLLPILMTDLVFRTAVITVITSLTATVIMILGFWRSERESGVSKLVPGFI